MSAPCTWDEIENGAAGPETFTLRTMAKRVEEVGDLWETMHEQGQSLGSASERLRSAAS